MMTQNIKKNYRLACINCGSKYTVVWGKTRDGNKRFKCKKSFSISKKSKAKLSEIIKSPSRVSSISNLGNFMIKRIHSTLFQVKSLDSTADFYEKLGFDDYRFASPTAIPYQTWPATPTGGAPILIWKPSKISKLIKILGKPTELSQALMKFRGNTADFRTFEDVKIWIVDKNNIF